MENKIICLQASAGSGKTYNLAKRYIRLLFDGNKPENIMAVTFTNKAYIEMKYRIIDYLKKAALGLETGDIFDGIKDCQSESSKILDGILKNYGSFNIKTIDSFKNYILKSCALILDISPNFSIEKDYSDYLMFALDSFLQKASHCPPLQAIVLEYLKQYILLEESGWFPKKNIFAEMKIIFDKTSNTGKDINKNETAFKDLFEEMSRSVYENHLSLYEKIADLNINKTFKNSLLKAKTNWAELTRKMKFSAYFLRDGLEYNDKKNARRSAEADELFEKTKEGIEALVSFYAYNYYAPYTQMYSYILEEFDLKAEKDELVFLNEINKKTKSLFRDKDRLELLPEIYCRLAERYNHFLIDEFQDTSFVQWSGICGFVDEILSNGGTFFYVGDIKQAIYRFRGGDPSLFYAAQKQFPNADFEERILDGNFRSCKTIVEFNNKAFSADNIKTFLSEDKDFCGLDYSDILRAYDFSHQNINVNKDDGYVETAVIPEDAGDADECIKEKVLQFVEDICGRFPLNEISILCRNNSQIEKIVLRLMERGYPVETAQTLNLKNSPLIKQIISFMKFIHSPYDNLSFSSFILGDIFCNAAGIAAEEIEYFLFESSSAIKSYGKSGAGTAEYSYKLFRKKYPHLWTEFFEFFFDRMGFVPIYEFIVSTIDKFKIMENFKDGKIFLLRLLELINLFEKESSDFGAFIEWFEHLPANDENLYLKSGSDGIKIMTVHNAKGLQFPVVIIPFLTLSAKSENRFFEEENEQIKVVRITDAFKNFSPNLNKLYDGESMRFLLDELNVLYVCLTRAECEMYMIMPHKDGRHGNKVQQLIGYANAAFGKKTRSKNTRKPGGFFIDSFDNGYRNIEIAEGSDGIFAAEKSRKRILGSMKHFALSRIKTLKNKNLGEELKKAVFDARRKFVFENDSGIYEELKDFLTDASIRRFFDYEADDVFNEKDIVDENGRTYRIDKAIFDGQKILVCDFKNSIYNLAANIRQVKKYISLLQQIDENAEIEGFIIDISAKKIEAVK